MQTAAAGKTEDASVGRVLGDTGVMWEKRKKP